MDEARGVSVFFPVSNDAQENAFLAHWVARRMPTFDGSVPFGPCYCIGFMRGPRLLAAAVYHDYQGHDIRLSGAAESTIWATKPAMRMLFWYPFEKLGVRRVTTVTARRNKRARRFNVRVGFKLEGVHERAYDGADDAISYGMLRERCPWLAAVPSAAMGGQ